MTGPKRPDATGSRPLLFTDGMFTPQALDNRRTEEVLLAATDRATGQVRPSDVLHAAIVSGDAKIIGSLAKGLQDGAKPDDVREIIEIYNPSRQSSEDFDGRRERFSAEAIAALDDFAAEVASGPDGSGDVYLELLIVCVLSHLDPEERQELAILDVDGCVRLLREQVRVATEPLTPLFASGSGRVRSEEFSEAAWTVLEHAGLHAAELGYERILPPHCFLALLSETEGLTEHLIRLQVSPEVSPAKVAAGVAEAFRLGERRGDALAVTRDNLGEAFVSMLHSAQRIAPIWGAERIDAPHLLAAILSDMPARLASALQRHPANIDLGRMRNHLEQALLEARTKPPREAVFRLPPGLPRNEDLTWYARTTGIQPALHLDGYFDALTRALYRKANNNVLITGPRGVGTTSLVWELARRAAAGEISFLRAKRFLWVDCREVSSADSGGVLATIISQVGGRTDLVLCIDGLGPLLRAESGANHKTLLRSALKDQRIHLVGVMESHDYEDLVSADHAMLEFLTRIDVTEPDRPAATAIAGQCATVLAEEFGVTIDRAAVERAVAISADSILNERLPAKAVKVLRRACEDLDYERSQLSSTRTAVGADDVVRVIAEISGIPEGQLSGTGSPGSEIDYEHFLGEIIHGQEQAVVVAADQLRRIKAGLTDPGKPASVMLFAGLTGTGKTELAKAIARFYSASKRLQTYPMANFTEAHSVSGITGVPPGYVGYEHGGRLINDLNADPYCVFLLDEAEKAHPDVWKPFLNLFDEAWVTDMRGVKAFGDRAIFILTSNAGSETISKLSGSKLSGKRRSMQEIIAAVRDELSQVLHKSGVPVFPPEFLARISQIIVFKPLDRNAMEGICRKMIARKQQTWLDKRGKRLIIPDSLVRYIAERGDHENAESGGKEGGRIIGKLIAEIIDGSLVRESTRQPEAYRMCEVVELAFLPPGPPLPGQPPPSPKVKVILRAGSPVDSPDSREQAVVDLRQVLRDSGLTGTPRAVEFLTRLESALVEGAEPADGLLLEVQEGLRRLVEHDRRTEEETRVVVQHVVSKVVAAAEGPR
jgi:ATP-dependent Clp protease ATP-binding subunit ClpA